MKIISAATSLQKSRRQKLDASTASKLPSRISQQDVLAPHRQVRQGIPPRNYTFCKQSKQCHAFSIGKVGAKMVHLYRSQLCQTHDCIRCGRRDILLGSFCSIFWLKK
jgi:hypothetical protein